MGVFLWALAVGVGYAGYRGYRKLQAIEEDLRQEVAGGSLLGKEAKTGGEVVEKPAVVTRPESVESPANLEARILRRVKEQPGILQTEIYGLFPGEKRRLLQEHLKGMDRAGVLKRVKEGGTYKLLPG